MCIAHAFAAHAGRYPAFRPTSSSAIQKGNETLFGDAFANYRRKAPWGKGSMLLQLNVTLSVIGRRNADGNAIRRVYLNEPRRYRFTTTLSFEGAGWVSSSLFDVARYRTILRTKLAGEPTARSAIFRSLW